jgi:hypothetical protein
VCDLYLRSTENAAAEWFVDILVDEVLACAIRDSLNDPRLYKSDLPELLRERYRRHIAQRRSLSKTSPIPEASSVTTNSAAALAKLIMDEATETGETQELQSVISQRLQWTSRELTG